MAKYLSVCSGIEAVSVSWKSLGWKPVGFSEIEKFPCEVLKHHYPSVPNLGDMTNYKEWQIEKPDIIIGGTPCQSFSIAGLRKGLEDPRGNLTLTFIGLLDHFKPTWFVWENVPGVLSNNKGRDFHTFIEGLQEIGYSLSWRVLDAQFFGVPQRRKRVFVVGHRSADWRYSYKALFESESLSGYLEKSRNKGSTRQATTKSTESIKRNDWPKQISNTLDAHFGDKMGLEDQHINSGCPRFVPTTVYENHGTDSRVKPLGKVCTTVTARWGTGGNNTPLVGDSRIRRLSPIECERLQGFPDDYTNIKGDKTPYGARYKALGNSMAVPVIEWIGRGIQKVEEYSNG